MKFGRFSVYKSLVILTLVAGNFLVWSIVYEKWEGRGFSYKNVQTITDLPAMQLDDADVMIPDGYPSLIRIYELQGKTYGFICSGSVISDKYILTAAHCLVDDKEHLQKKEVHIKLLDVKSDVEVVGTPAAINVDSDLGLITGDFSKFNKLHITKVPFAFIWQQIPFVTCGYPWGGGDICHPFHPNMNYHHFIEGFGYLAPGMSGGPVLAFSDVGLIVIGVNSATLPGGVLIAPLLGIFENAGIEVK